MSRDRIFLQGNSLLTNTLLQRGVCCDLGPRTVSTVSVPDFLATGACILYLFAVTILAFVAACF